VVFEKEYIMQCSPAEWIARNGCALRWCHRGVGRWTEETVGFSKWTAQFFVWKTTGKDSSQDCAVACQNCAVYSVFPSGMTSHNTIVHCNWACIGQFIFQSLQENDGIMLPKSRILLSQSLQISRILKSFHVIQGWTNSTTDLSFSKLDQSVHRLSTS